MGLSEDGGSRLWPAAHRNLPLWCTSQGLQRGSRLLTPRISLKRILLSLWTCLGLLTPKRSHGLLDPIKRILSRIHSGLKAQRLLSGCFFAQHQRAKPHQLTGLYGFSIGRGLYSIALRRSVLAGILSSLVFLAPSVRADSCQGTLTTNLQLCLPSDDSFDWGNNYRTLTSMVDWMMGPVFAAMPILSSVTAYANAIAVSTKSLQGQINQLSSQVSTAAYINKYQSWTTTQAFTQGISLSDGVLLTSSTQFLLVGQATVTTSSPLSGNGSIASPVALSSNFQSDVALSTAGALQATGPLFSAKCDGLTNDLVAIQNCINTAAAAGAYCQLPPKRLCEIGAGGTHTPLTMPSNAKLKGPGTLVLNTDGGGICGLASHGAIQISSGNVGVRLENLTLQGNSSNDSCLVNISSTVQVGYVTFDHVSLNGSPSSTSTIGIMLGNIVDFQMNEGGFDTNFKQQVSTTGTFSNIVAFRDVLFQALLPGSTQFVQAAIGTNGTALVVDNCTFETGPNSINMSGIGSITNNYFSDPVNQTTGTWITADGFPGFGGTISNNFMASEGSLVYIDGIHMHGAVATISGNFMDSQMTSILLTGSGNVVQGNYLYGPPHTQGIHVSTGAYNLIGPNQYFQNASKPEEVCDSSATYNHIISATAFQTGNGCVGNGNIVENLPNGTLTGYSQITITASTTSTNTGLIIKNPSNQSPQGSIALKIVAGPGGLDDNEQFDLWQNSNNFPDPVTNNFRFGTYGDTNFINEFGADLNIYSGTARVARFGGGQNSPVGQVKLGSAPYESVFTSSGSFISPGTVTVQGNAFSVGGSSFTITGGSATVAFLMTAGAFNGDGSALTNIAQGSIAGLLAKFSSVGVSTSAIATSTTSLAIQLQNSTITVSAAFTGSGSSSDPLTANSSSITLQGNTFNGANQLLEATAAGKYPALDGSLITNTPPPTQYFSNLILVSTNGASAVTVTLSTSGVMSAASIVTTGSTAVTLLTNGSNNAWITIDSDNVVRSRFSSISGTYFNISLVDPAGGIWTLSMDSDFVIRTAASGNSL